MSSRQRERERSLGTPLDAPSVPARSGGAAPSRSVPAECLAVHADRSLSGQKVAAALDEVAGNRGYPKEITVDNGTDEGSKEAISSS